MDERELLLELADTARRMMAFEYICPDAEALDALTALRTKVHTLDLFLSSSYEPDTPRASVRLKECDKCGASFFFAKLSEERWLPIEVDTVAADEMIPNCRYVVDFSRCPAGPPWVRVSPTKAHGEVWINHMDVCGTGDGPRHQVSALIRRWKVNVARTDCVIDDTVAQLQKLRTHLGSKGDSADS